MLEKSVSSEVSNYYEQSVLHLWPNPLLWYSSVHWQHLQLGQSSLEQNTSFFGYLYRFFTPFLSFLKFYLHLWTSV